MRVDLQILLRQLVAILSAPNRSVAQEETLQAGEAVDFRSIGKRGFDGFRGTILAAAGRFIESERIALRAMFTPLKSPMFSPMVNAPFT